MVGEERPNMPAALAWPFNLPNASGFGLTDLFLPLGELGLAPTFGLDGALGDSLVVSAALKLGSVGVLTICTGLFQLISPSILTSLSSCVENSTLTPGSASNSNSLTNLSPIPLSFSTAASLHHTAIRSPLGRTLHTAPQHSSASSNSSPINPSTNQSQLRSTSAGFRMRNVIVHLPPRALCGSSHMGLMPSLKRW